MSERGERVLVVDDEPGVLETIAAILKREGYAVTAVSDPARAIAELKNEPFAVVLTDLRMEDSTGLSLVAEVRRCWPETSAVILTGYASLQSAIDALREGAYDYLIKPCDVEELKSTIGRAVERSVLARALRQRIADLDSANHLLSELNAQLEERIRAATADLSEKVSELAEAKLGLEEERRRREQFIAMVIHELRQPLTGLNASAQLIARPGSTETARERARATVVSQVQRINRLVQDLADVSNLASESFSLRQSAWDVVALVREQVDAIRAAEGGSAVIADVPPETVPFVGDRDRIAQVLSNLLSNAVKYAAEGLIVARTRVESNRVVLTVHDSGPGIPPDRLETIFEPYVRLAQPDRPNRPSGLGLGLYIARRIVEMHGGTIRAESSTRGAAFIVELPLNQTPELAGAAVASSLRGVDRT